MRQSYPIYACTGTNHARHLIGSEPAVHFAAAGKKLDRR